MEARKGIQHVDVPPIRSDSTAAAAGPPGGTINGEMYIADGDYIKDIEVNDLRNRYTLTKGSTQKMVNTLPGLLLLIYKQAKHSVLVPPSPPHNCGLFPSPMARSSLAYTGSLDSSPADDCLFGRC